MLDLTNFKQLLTSLNSECNSILSDERTSFGAQLLMLCDDSIYRETWSEGKMLITVFEKEKKKDLCYIVKYKSGDLLWFEYFFPKVKNPKLITIQNSIKQIFESLQFQEVSYQVNELTTFNLKAQQKANPKSKIGKNLYFYIFFLFPNFICDFGLVPNNLLNYTSLLIFTDFFFAYSIAFIFFAFFVQPYETYNLPRKSAKLGPVAINQVFDKIEFQVNLKLIDNLVNNFCSFIYYNQYGELFKDDEYFNFDRDYYIVDQESKLKIAKFNIVDCKPKPRIVITPILSSDKKFQSIGLAYLELLDCENYDNEKFTLQLAKNNLAKPETNYFLNSFYSNDVPGFYKFHAVLIATFAISTLVGLNFSFDYLMIPFGIMVVSLPVAFGSFLANH